MIFFLFVHYGTSLSISLWLGMILILTQSCNSLCLNCLINGSGLVGLHSKDFRTVMTSNLKDVLQSSYFLCLILWNINSKCLLKNMSLEKIYFGLLLFAKARKEKKSHPTLSCWATSQSQIYLKEVALSLSWIGWEITHWADRADMADIPFQLYKSKLGTFLWIW